MPRPGCPAIALLAAALVVPQMLLIARAQQPSNSTMPPRMIVTPSSGVVFSGLRKGPFSPPVVAYRVSASAGAINYVITTPPWLTASPSSGAADTAGVTVTFTVNASAANLAPGAYGPAVAFRNVTNGLGSTIRSATLKVETSQFLMDGRGGYLLDDAGRRLLAR
jgi:hypothetical protein